MKTLIRWPSLLLVVAFVSGGCATKGQLRALQDRVVQLERQRRALQSTYERDQRRLKRLRHEIETSSRYLRRNGARINARVDDLEDALRRSKGASEVLVHRIQRVAKQLRADHASIQALSQKHTTLVADLRDRAGISVLALPRDLPEHADEWIKLAIDRFGWGEVRVAEAIAKECRKRFRGTSQAATCGILQGKIAYEEHRFGDAVAIFRGVHDELNGKAIPVVVSALMNISRTFEAQGKCAQSKQVLGYVKNLMKGKPQAKQAAGLAKGIPGRCDEGKVKLPEPTSGALKRAQAAAKLAKEKAEAEAAAKRQEQAKAEAEREQKELEAARRARDLKAASEAMNDAARSEATAQPPVATTPKSPKGSVNSKTDGSDKDSDDAKESDAAKEAGAPKDEKALQAQPKTAPKDAGDGAAEDK